jgi:hypothetical protein
METGDDSESMMALGAPAAKDFHHPFKPYDIQENFMRTVYEILDRGDGSVGILESPTGTVRLICFIQQRLSLYARF